RHILAARQHLDTPVRQIAGVSAYAQVLCAPRGCGAVEHALDATTHQTLLADHAQRILLEIHTRVPCADDRIVVLWQRTAQRTATRPRAVEDKAWRRYWFSTTRAAAPPPSSRDTCAAAWKGLRAPVRGCEPCHRCTRKAPACLSRCRPAGRLTPPSRI